MSGLQRSLGLGCGPGSCCGSCNGGMGAAPDDLTLLENAVNPAWLRALGIEPPATDVNLQPLDVYSHEASPQFVNPYDPALPYGADPQFYSPDPNYSPPPGLTAGAGMGSQTGWLMAGGAAALLVVVLAGEGRGRSRRRR